MKSPMERIMDKYEVNHLGMINMVMSGNNRTGHPDATVVICHAEAMQRRINELEKEVNELKGEYAQPQPS